MILILYFLHEKSNASRLGVPSNRRLLQVHLCQHSKAKTREHRECCHFSLRKHGVQLCLREDHRREIIPRGKHACPPRPKERDSFNQPHRGLPDPIKEPQLCLHALLNEDSQAGQIFDSTQWLRNNRYRHEASQADHDQAIPPDRRLRRTIRGETQQKLWDPDNRARGPEGPGNLHQLPEEDVVGLTIYWQ